MKYRLRTNLSKTAVFNLMVQHCQSSIQVPGIRSCDFKKHRGTYWLRFVDPASDRCYEFTFSCFAGVCVYLEELCYDEFGVFHLEMVLFARIPFEDCLAAGYLREVA